MTVVSAQHVPCGHSDKLTDNCQMKNIKKLEDGDMKKMLPLLVLIFSGCSTTPPGGFWGELRATKNDATFYTGKYVGSQTNCFPPIEKRQCIPLKGEAAQYEAEQKLQMEEFTLSLMSPDFFAGKRIKDMLFLAASDLAIQRGFNMFTIKTEIDTSTCRSGMEARTTGALSSIGDQINYSGTTTVRPSDKCLFSQSIRVLMFNDKAPLARGVLKKANSGSAQWLYPETSLYLGTIPNLKRSEFNYQPDPASLVRTPENAWKVHYEARELSSDLRAKYAVTDISPIPFSDELEANLKNEANDPVQKRRVVTP